MKNTEPGGLRITLLASGMFFASGATALVYQSVLNKLFSFVFGVSAYAAATVLAAFMFGLALGSFLVGRVASTRVRRHLLWYGIVELGVGLYGLVLIAAANWIEGLYTGLARDWALSITALTVLRFVSAAVLIAIPTTLMGGSLPLLVEGCRARGARQSVNVLYAFNTAGATIGVIWCAYWILPTFHLDGSLRLVAATNAIICVLAVLSEWLWPPRPPEGAHTAQAAARSALPEDVAWLAFFSGALVFASEVFWYHMLSVVIGMSTYAYAIMLFTTLLGMTVAGALVARLPAHRSELRTLAWSMLGFALSSWLLLPVWDDIPSVFLQLGLLVKTFEVMEGARFVLATVLIFAPALFAGATFPLLLNATERVVPDLAAQVGRLYAINTAGSIVGSLGAGFVLLPAFGGRVGLLLTASAAVVVSAVLLFPSSRWKAALAATLVALGCSALTPDWDARSLLSGANVYFSKAHDDIDELVWQREDSVGGVTSIIRTGKVLTMLTNGKFQGNNGLEVKDQERFALLPNLFVQRPTRALNLGLGTGSTLGTLTRFPYQEVDVVELSPDIVRAARQFFGDINRHSLDDPRVRVHVEDGRSFLALNAASRPYDLVSIEISSIWFAGAGNLYNDEFYALLKKNMRDDAVLQQWVQLHHISATDIAAVLKTLRRHFTYVQLWVPGHQGIIVASNSPLEVVPKRLEEAASFPPDTYFLLDYRTCLGELVLTAPETDAFISATESAAPVPVSSDLNLYLEYSTPRGNALGWNFGDNFQRFSVHSKHSVRDVLPKSLVADRELLGFARLGEAQREERFSPRWHEGIAAGLSELQPATRARVMATLRRDTAAAKPLSQ